MTTWSQDKYIKALRYAAQAHNKQVFPGTDLPYLVHITLVSMETIAALSVDRSKLDGDLAVQCALLHDVMEDAEKSYLEIRRIFGEKVADGVDALTKRKSFETKKEKMADSLLRIKKQPKAIWIVKMADRISNLQPPPRHWKIDKINAYKAEAIEIYNALKDSSRYLAERLKKKIESYPPPNPFSSLPRQQQEEGKNGEP